MQSFSGNQKEKRGRVDDAIADADLDGVGPQAKKKKVPALASVIVEALKLDSLQRLCSSIEPLLRRIVSEEVERALTNLGQAKLAGRASPPRIDGPGGRRLLQLHFRSRFPPHLFTGGKVEGDQGVAIHVVLLDSTTGLVVPSGPESVAKLNVVVLEGDFNDDEGDDWTREHFESYEVKEREGKRPLLTGDSVVTLKEGVGTLGDLTFTDNSSWIRSRKFRLGVKVVDGYCDGIRIREAKSEAFTVKDHRGELYKKHYPPALHDEVWRLDKIAKDGALHKKLIEAQVFTVEDFLQLLVRDPQRLRQILGSGMSKRMWEKTVEHAKTCVLGGKLYVYYTDETRSTGVVFNDIYEFRGLIANRQFLSAESLSHSQKVSVDSLVKRAYENWVHVVEYDGKALLKSVDSKETQAPPACTAKHKSSMDQLSVPSTHTTNYSSNLGVRFQNETTCFSEDNQPNEPNSFIRMDPTVSLALSTPQASISRSMDFHSVNIPTVTGVYGQAFDEFLSEEEIRLRSSEMLANDDMQRLLRSFNAGIGAGSLSQSELYYSYDGSCEPQVDYRFGRENGRSSGKAVVGWLKLKAALRWGIFVRKKAAERRAQLVELD